MVNFKQLQNKITLSTLYCFVSKKCLQLLIKIVWGNYFFFYSLTDMSNIMGNILKTLSFRLSDTQILWSPWPGVGGWFHWGKKHGRQPNTCSSDQQQYKSFKTIELHIVPNVSLKIEDSIFLSKQNSILVCCSCISFHVYCHSLFTTSIVWGRGCKFSAKLEKKQYKSCESPCLRYTKASLSLTIPDTV